MSSSANSGPLSLLRRYKWDNLSAAEQEAVSDSMRLAATRAGVGLGTVLTTAAVISHLRRGRRALPAATRYGALAFFSVAGAYAGFLSGGPMYARRILSVPESRLADDLRTVVGDWQMRAPAAVAATDGLGDARPHEPLPDAPVGQGRGRNEVIAADPRARGAASEKATE